MAITVTEIHTGRSGADNIDGERTYVRAFRALTDSPSVGTLSVRLAAGIPRVGDVYAVSGEQDLGAKVKTVDVQQGSSRLEFIVTVNYSSKVEKEPPEQNPLARPAEIVWQTETFTRPVRLDKDGDAILTPAQEEFDPLIEADDARAVLVVTKNFPSFNPSMAYDYSNAINSDPFMGAEPLTLKVSIQASNESENDIDFWKVTARFSHRRETWKEVVQNQGFWYLSSAGSTVRLNAADDRNNPTNSPIPLAANGTKLAPGGTIAYSTFHIYDEKPFSQLGFF